MVKEMEITKWKYKKFDYRKRDETQPLTIRTLSVFSERLVSQQHVIERQPIRKQKLKKKLSLKINTYFGKTKKPILEKSTTNTTTSNKHAFRIFLAFTKP